MRPRGADVGGSQEWNGGHILITLAWVNSEVLSSYDILPFFSVSKQFLWSVCEEEREDSEKLLLLRTHIPHVAARSCHPQEAAWRPWLPFDL